MRTMPIKVEHAQAVAALHIQGIDKGFISSLGIKFVTALYEAIAQSSSSFGFTAEDDDGRVLGFVTFTSNVGKLYKAVVAKKGWRFAFLLVGRMFSLRRIKKVFETLFYPSRVKKMDLPSAELLSIVVDSHNYRAGLGTELVHKSFEECRRKGLEKVKVLVGADNEAANRLYQKCGFEFVGRIENHGVASNIYEVEVEKALNENFGGDESVRTYSFGEFSEKPYSSSLPKAVARVA